MKESKTAAVTVRLDQELKNRLAHAAERLDLSENYIVRHAVRAAITEIEANDYKIELPLELVLKKAPPVSRVERGAFPAIRQTGRKPPPDISLNEPEGQYASGKKTTPKAKQSPK